MSLLSSFTKNSRLQAAIKTVKEARQTEGGRADQLFLKAYREFADVVAGDLVLAQSLYNWGFALLQQARTKADAVAIQLYEEAIAKFTFCATVDPNFLGAAIDGGVALMEFARMKQVQLDDPLYGAAKAHFERAEQIHKGSAVYNLACIYALMGQDDLCLVALSDAVKYGSLPSEQEVMHDPDLEKVKTKGWFLDFMASLQTAKVKVQPVKVAAEVDSASMAANDPIEPATDSLTEEMKIHGEEKAEMVVAAKDSSELPSGKHIEEKTVDDAGERDSAAFTSKHY